MRTKEYTPEELKNKQREKLEREIRELKGKQKVYKIMIARFKEHIQKCEKDAEREEFRTRRSVAASHRRAAEITKRDLLMATQGIDHMDQRIDQLTRELQTL